MSPLGAAGRIAAASALLFAAAPLAPASATGSVATLSIFKAPEPEMVYDGSAIGSEPGVDVARDQETLKSLVAVLDPEPAGPLPETRKRTVLRIVGRAREDLCRQSSLRKVSTRSGRATVSVEERTAEPGCSCGVAALPPRAWLVTVSRSVRKADLVVTETTVPCDAALENASAEGPTMLLEGSWDESPGALLVHDPDRYRELLSRLQLKDRGPDVDFSTHAIAVVTGRARTNGCRKTAAIAAEIASEGGKSELIVTLEEVYPPPRTACTQIFQLPRVFLYRVPGSVSAARVVTKEVRPDR